MGSDPVPFLAVEMGKERETEPSSEMTSRRWEETETRRCTGLD